MKLEQNKIDELNIQLSLNITPEDYAEPMKKKLNEYRRKAEFKGFRKGNVPMSLIQKVYGESVLGDTINDIISEQLGKHIQENNLRVLGEPILSEDQPQNEWKNGNEFNYKFDLGLIPEFSVAVSTADNLPIYKIEVTDEAKAEMKENVLRQYGELQETTTAGETDYLVVDFAQPEVENGVSAEGVMVYIGIIAQEQKAKFVGLKADDKIQVNVNEAFTNETDRAQMLKIDKAKLSEINPEFEMTVVNVKTFAPAEECQQTYDKIFGEGVVNTADDFDQKILSNLEANYAQEAEGRLSKDIRDMLMSKAQFDLPETFLKRWLFVANKGKVTKEDIEKEFDAFIADYRWQMVRSEVMHNYDLKVDMKDLQEAAEGYVAYQYASYGLGNVPEDMIKQAAKRVLEDERQSRSIEESVYDQKAITAVRNAITLQEKTISMEDFRALK